MPKESVVFLAGVLLSSILIPCFLPIFRRLGIVDRPNARSAHSTAIPRGMGLVVVINFVVILVGYCFLVPNVPLEEQGRLHALIWAVVLLVGVGFLDDTRGVSAYVKLLFQCGSAAILVLGHFVMPLPDIFGQYQTIFEQAFTLLWIVGVINAVNFIDGSDGLATTLSALCMILFVGISRILPPETAKAADPLVRSINLLGLAGTSCALPFLLFNLSPAKCFLGDSGSMFFGLLLAILGVLTAQFNAPSGVVAVAGPREFYASYFLVPWLVLAVPIIDALRVAIGRVLNKKSPFRPDNRHLHHLLHRSGLSPNQTLFLVSIAVLTFGLTAAILVRAKQSPFLLMGIVVLLVYGLLWFVKSSYHARRFVTLLLNRKLLHFMDVAEGYESPATFKQRFDQELARARRHGGAFTVVIVNALTKKITSPGASPLENPKFLESLLRALRREDLKCRFSNDRLAFLLVETDKELCETPCRRIWERFQGISQGESSDLRVGLGVASFPGDGDTVTSLLKLAEADALGSLNSPESRWDRPLPVPTPAGTAAAVPAAKDEVKPTTPPSALPEGTPRPRWEVSRSGKEVLISQSSATGGKRLFAK